VVTHQQLKNEHASLALPMILAIFSGFHLLAADAATRRVIAIKIVS